MRKNQGFTLVELVVVIVVLGLLAVVALPRFMNVTDQAKQASIEGVAGGFSSAVLSVRAQWEAKGRPVDSTGYVVDYDGTEFYLTDSAKGDFRDGYPIQVKDSISGSITVINNVSCKNLMDQLLQNPPLSEVTSESEVSKDSDNKAVKYQVHALDSTTCRYTQNNTPYHYFDYDLHTGKVTTTLK